MKFFALVGAALPLATLGLQLKDRGVDLSFYTGLKSKKIAHPDDKKRKEPEPEPDDYELDPDTEWYQYRNPKSKYRWNALSRPKETCPDAKNISPTMPTGKCTKRSFCEELREFDRRATLQAFFFEMHFSKVDDNTGVYKRDSVLSNDDLTSIVERANFYSSGKLKLELIKPNAIYESNAVMTHACSPGAFTRYLTPTSYPNYAKNIINAYGTVSYEDYESPCAEDRKKILRTRSTDIGSFDNTVFSNWCGSIFSLNSYEKDGLCYVNPPTSGLNSDIHTGILDCDKILEGDAEADTPWTEAAPKGAPLFTANKSSRKSYSAWI
uniref:Uncharacterized protein n=1 Tax=Chromera velia CCMP2878 TaxID=1169474 RepID=A0A0G4ICL6_9ALVE|eukprot:Cvel_13162.t1-p1 / transcript=Cvel_13162.t1 / gene=Cvel_13162 / organism=Chromera_velia_CCMP2878 / gene_product=hypothetical protein / transcript_product=hypothetical protein / location=Cvel_scaffold888:55620-58419(+) / protein_length=323 / sequence_SO=supercontig / SO=protein_coding / is_pseudo=false